MIDGKTVFNLIAIEYDWAMVEESTLRIRFKLCCIVKLVLFFQTNLFLRVFIFVIIVLFMMSNYDGNIYTYKSSNLQTQK